TAASAAARSANAPTRTRCNDSVVPADAALGVGAGAGAVPSAARARLTWTFNPSVASSFESDTASRSGRLGRTTTPSPDASTERPLEASFALRSGDDDPATWTS